VKPYQIRVKLLSSVSVAFQTVDMSYQVLARKWRPQLFDQLVGQQHVVTALSNALTNNRLHHAYLFTGTRGVGKTTLARIFAKSLNCETGISAAPCGVCDACREIDEGRFVDLLEVDAASRTKVDQTRELLENVPYAPVRGRYKVYLIDEVHMFSSGSFNALLKTLEEPPPHVKFILATTDPQKVPITVLSRCLQFNLKRLSHEQIEAQLRHILTEEKIPYDDESLSLLARGADGSMRDGLSLLDQAIAFGGGELQGEDVRSMIGVIGAERITLLLDALVKQQGNLLMDQVAEMAEIAIDFSQALQELLAMLHQIALLQLIPDYYPDEPFDVVRLKEVALALTPEDVQLYYQIGLMGQKELNLAPDPRSGFEMIVLRMLAFLPDVPSAQAGETTPQQQSNEPNKPPPSKPLQEPTQPESTKEASENATHPVESTQQQSPDPSDWEPFSASLRLGGITRQLVQNCAFQDWDGQTLCLTLDSSRGQLRVAQSEKRLLESLRKRLGDHMQLRIDEAVPSDETPAMQQQRRQEERKREAEASITSDPLVKELEERFSARVLSDTIRPVDENA
jgi:DNA polymerase-3 subunit gamma/tau